MTRITAHKKWYHCKNISQPTRNHHILVDLQIEVFWYFHMNKFYFLEELFFPRILCFRLGLFFCRGVLHMDLCVDEVRVEVVSFISTRFIFLSCSNLFLTKECSNWGHRTLSQNHSRWVTICCHKFHQIHQLCMQRNHNIF